MPHFNPIIIGGHYTGIYNGILPDILACHSLDGNAHSVCTALISASHGRVSDVLPVPSDTVAVQLEHLSQVVEPTGVKIGIMCDLATIENVWAHLRKAAYTPIVWDLTLSGPSGEDLINTSTQTLTPFFPLPDLITIGLQDASLLARMEIHSLDDAQVAIQRLHKLGMRHILLRCHTLRTRFFETDNDLDQRYASNLYFDGDEFALFEIPAIDEAKHPELSSYFSLSLLKALVEQKQKHEAIQEASSFVVDAFLLKK